MVGSVYATDIHVWLCVLVQICFCFQLCITLSSACTAVHYDRCLFSQDLWACLFWFCLQQLWRFLNQDCGSVMKFNLMKCWLFVEPGSQSCNSAVTYSSQCGVPLTGCWPMRKMTKWFESSCFMIWFNMACAMSSNGCVLLQTAITTVTQQTLVIWLCSNSVARVQCMSDAMHVQCIGQCMQPTYGSLCLK